jgi:hypothetical protein
MKSPKEIAEEALLLQREGKDYVLTEIPSFKQWYENKSKNGGNESAIDHMFAMSMFMLPCELADVSDEDFNEIYEDILSDLD